MPIYKLVSKLSAGGNGWTESHYYDSGDLSSFEVIEDLANYTYLRKRLLGTGGALVGLTLIETFPPHLSFSFGANIGAGPGTYTAGQSLPWMAAMFLAWSTGRIYQRVIELRGWVQPEWNWDAADPFPTQLGPTVRQRAEDFLGFLTGGVVPEVDESQGRWGMYNISRENITKQTVRLTGITAGNKGVQWSIVTKDARLDWVLGDTIHVSRVRGRGIEGLNANHVIANKVSNTEFQLETTQADSGVPYISFTGYAWKVARSFTGYADSQFDRFVKRDTGRPFGLTVGRRSRGR